MKKWIRSLALAATVAFGTAGVVTLSGTPAHGQVKAKQDPKTKADPKAKAEAKGSVVITKDKQGKFRFQVKNDAGKTVMQSVVGYISEKDAVAAFEEALAIAKSAKPTVEKEKGGK